VWARFAEPHLPSHYDQCFLAATKRAAIALEQRMSLGSLVLAQPQEYGEYDFLIGRAL
jgi:hypothetical protein